MEPSCKGTGFRRQPKEWRGKNMLPREKQEKEEREWSDRNPDMPDRDGVEDARDDAYEKNVYRDGSVKHECWKED